MANSLGYIEKNIRDYCKEKNVELKSLCEKSGVSETVLYRNFQKGDYKVSTLESISKALGVSVSQLTTDPGVKAYKMSAELVIVEEPAKLFYENNRLLKETNSLKNKVIELLEEQTRLYKKFSAKV